MQKPIYEPCEDSIMLSRCVRKYAKGRVLDVGTGSGIQAIKASQKKNVVSVLATDVQRKVIGDCKRRIKNKKIRFLQSDLFERISGEFDTIIFNPPYLPQELQAKDLRIEGGKKGYETIGKFINEANKFLSMNGIILMIFSSLTNKEKVEDFIENNLMDFKELEKKHIFFEDIYAYLLEKNEFLKKLESKGITDVAYMAKGHRGLLFLGKYKNKKVAIKTKNPKSAAAGRIENEAKWLKRLNRHKIGPEMIMSEGNYFIYRFIDGKFIIDYMDKSGGRHIKKIIKKIFSQMFMLDKLGVDKEEMHHPLKHIIVCNGKPCLIDFERAHFTQKPKNVTQFCQFLIGGRVNHLFMDKGIRIKREEVMRLAKIYKNEQNIKNFNNLKNSLFL